MKVSILLAFIVIISLLLSTPHFSYPLPQSTPAAGSSPITSAASAESGIISGKVIWQKHDISNATIQVFKDPSLKKLYATAVLLKENGEYAVSVEPGEYYVTAYIDDNKNGIFDSGDGMGVYGVIQWDNPKQQNKPIAVQKGDKLKGMDIKISARMLDTGKSKRLIPIKNEKLTLNSAPAPEDDSAEFTFELARLANGISGRIVSPENRFENVSVFSYSDLNWKTRIGQAKVDQDGKYKLYLSPGKYYLLTVADENLSDFFDQGDKFGVYGLTNLKKRDEFPKFALVERGKIVENVDILIIGMQNAQGKILPLLTNASESESGSAQGLEATDAPAALNFSAKISGKVIWEEHDLAGGIIQVYEDSSLTQAVGRTVVDQNGYFDLRLKPGEYYVIANVDSDKNGKYNSGDGIGGYGSEDISNQPPSKVKLVEGDNPQMEIPITATYNRSGQFQSIYQPLQDDKNFSSGISGKIYWDGRDIDIERDKTFILVSKNPLFERADTYAIKLDEAGSYKLGLEEGDYYLMAVVDSSRDEKAGSGDGLGVYGTNAPMVNMPQLISVFKGLISEHADINIRAIFTDDNGNVFQILNASRTEIRQQYGEPEDIFHNTEFGKQMEEWWYWSRGISFKFETDGISWVLKESNKFKPSQKAKDLVEKTKTSETEINGISGSIGSIGSIYYSFDKVIWIIAPSGLGFPLALGSQPTASTDRSKVAFLDIDGNVRVIEANDLNGKIVIKRSEEASKPVISFDGRYIVFIQKFENSSKLCIKHIATGEKRVLPIPDSEPQTANWNPNGQLIVYSASPKRDNRINEMSRRIYVYDLVDDRIDPITDGSSDDSDPVWSPADPNTFAYVRQSEDRPQVWAVTIPKDGKPVERQITKYGGKSPAWIPDGSGIVYENNAQIWVIKFNGSNASEFSEFEEKPILINGNPVFGLTPFVR